MGYRPVLVVVLASLAALVVLVLAGRRVLVRDREALYDRFVAERTREVEDAARGFGTDVANVAEDLELAATLLDKAETPRVAERELHAIATIKREYVVMTARTGTHEDTRVVAFDAPPAIDDIAAEPLALSLSGADAAPDTLIVSQRFIRNGPEERWYRAFARNSSAHHITIGIVVDMSLLMRRVKLSNDATSRYVIVGPHGAATPPEDAAVARLAPAGADGSGAQVSLVSASAAASAGLPATSAFVIAVPVQVTQGAPWRIVMMSSTSPLDEQEHMLIRRVLAGSGLVVLLLLLAAVYVIHNTRRAAMLRERLRSAARLEHLTERAEKIVDHIPSGVLMVSEDGRVTGANRWFKDRFGREVASGPLGTVLPDLPSIIELVDAAGRARQPRSLHRTQLALFGQDTTLNVHAIPLERGIADVSMLVVFEDLTPLRRIEERLLHSEKLVTAGQLAAGIAHEVGTPLNVARGRVEMAMSHLGEQHAEAGNHRVAIEQIDRVTRLIQQLLDYVRPAPEAMQNVEPPSALRAVRDLLAAQANKRGVSIEVDVANDLPAIHADPDQIQQILVNLVLNALDACGSEGHIALSASPRDGAIVFEVADDGHGIPREQQSQVFDPFFTTKKRGQGTGLGLWVVAQIVRAHAAEIELESAPGAGTKVRIIWPVAA